MNDTCGACGATLGPSETIHVAGEGPRYYPCFNREIAERIGVDDDEPQFQPLVLEDAEGTPHRFLIRSILVPTGHELEAFEKTEGLVLEWAQLHRQELLDDWERARRRQPLERIPPLEQP